MLEYTCLVIIIIIVQSKSELVYTQTTTHICSYGCLWCSSTVWLLSTQTTESAKKAKDLSRTFYRTLVLCAWWFNYPGRLLKRFRVDFRPKSWRTEVWGA